MLDSLLQQLQHPDPAERKQAIIALANAKDPAALPALQFLYQNDPELELREMALKAGRYIQMAQSKQSAPPPGASAGSGSTPPPPPPPQYSSSTEEITQRDIELSRGYLDATTGYFTQGDRGRAIESLGKALALNPKLQREPFAANLIVTLTGRPVSEGVPLLINPQSRADLVTKMGGKPKLKVQDHGKGADTATWSNVLIDLSLYAIITILATLAVFTVGLDGLQDFYDQYSSLSMVESYGTQEEIDWDVMSDISLALLIPIAIAAGIGSVVGLVLQAAGIHVAATMVLGGNGTLVYLLRRYVPFQTIVALIYGLVGVIMFVLLPSQPDMITIIAFLSVPASIALIYFSAALVADVYAFGWGSGCGAILIGGIIVSVGLGICNCLLSSALIGGSGLTAQ